MVFIYIKNQQLNFLLFVFFITSISVSFIPFLLYLGHERLTTLEVKSNSGFYNFFVCILVLTIH